MRPRSRPRADAGERVVRNRLGELTRPTLGGLQAYQADQGSGPPRTAIAASSADGRSLPHSGRRPESKDLRSCRRSIPKVSDRGAVRSQVVGDQPLGNEGILLQELAHQFQRGVLVPLGLDQHIEDLALGAHGAP